MKKNNRVSVSLSRFILFILILIFTTSAMAEYYIVYPPSAVPCCHTRYAKVYKRHYRHYRNPCKKSYHRVYRASPRIQKYYVYQSCCGGAYWVPTCDTCGNFYVPPEYYYRSNYYYYDSYYYDPAIDWDMRTMDDY